MSQNRIIYNLQICKILSRKQKYETTTIYFYMGLLNSGYVDIM